MTRNALPNPEIEVVEADGLHFDAGLAYDGFRLIDFDPPKGLVSAVRFNPPGFHQPSSFEIFSAIFFPEIP